MKVDPDKFQRSLPLPRPLITDANIVQESLKAQELAASGQTSGELEAILQVFFGSGMGDDKGNSR